MSKTLVKDKLFMNADDVLFALRSHSYDDLFKIAPNYDNFRLPGENGGSNNLRPSRGMKKKQVGFTANGEQIHPNKRFKSELTQPKLPPNGFPAEFPFNKDGYRYFLAEPDINGPHRKEFDESIEFGGKQIPGWLCRKLMPERILLSLHDRAPQLKVSDDRLTVTGEKGYCMIRASSGVSHGTWYFEIKINDMPEKSATRIGWAQELANLQTPLGYDKFGYSWRSRKGTKFHESMGKCAHS